MHDNAVRATYELVIRDTTVRLSVGEGERVHRLYLVSPPVPGAVTVNIDIALSGRGASADIRVVVVPSPCAAVSVVTRQHHEAPDTASNLLVSSAVGDHSSVSFDGLIRIEQAAQRSDAYQRSESLALAPTSKSESRPTLEILANDVRCTHGAVAKPPPDDEVWYLASRGIGRLTATGLIVSGFLSGSSDPSRTPQEFHADLDKSIGRLAERSADRV